MTSAPSGHGDGGRGLTPADLQQVRFSRASMLHPGYVESEVDRVLHRAAEELSRHVAEKAQLREQVRTLQSQLNGAPAHVPPSEQAVRILASAQQTADNYVAEAEKFSRQVTGEARAEYEEAVRLARENAGAIIQAAQEAAARLTGPAPDGPAQGGGRSVAELEEQVAYLKAFGQACRVQLRSYLEALLSDVENEWGQADPGALPTPPPARRAAADTDADRSTTFDSNTASDQRPEQNEGVPAGSSARPAS
ncbi:DivIVA domain-containing protein [Blastococcus xanthinilyticus]|uniref:Cell wall synthesis protein Wag31 n=1 Tax=Blastococcus xanthinilyticus TaxID=1564164 RepID=A0A5S5D251_9ACTN|nr:DivIVA domain-containing protein [Blastococcus xanthinilyticus]TYP88892.1 DivIVA domain-containing protein [Blastococcus xanthinilyticus]